MGRPGVTYHDVAKAAKVLTGRGISPTIEGIRSELKSGSYSTIAPLLKRWKDDSAHTELLSGDDGRVPSELIVAINNLWDCMTLKADEKVLAIKANMQESINRLESQLKSQKQEAQSLSQSNNKLQQALEEIKKEKISLEHDVSIANSNNDKSASELAVAKKQLEEKQFRIDELNHLNQQAQNNLEHYRDSAREQRNIDLHMAEKNRLDLENQITSLQETLTAIERDKLALDKQSNMLINEISSLNDNKKTLLNELSLMKTTLSNSEKNIACTKSEISTYQRQVESLSGDLKDKTDRVATLEKQLAVQTEKADSLKCRVQHIEEQNKILLQDKWEIAQEKSLLLGQLKQMQAA